MSTSPSTPLSSLTHRALQTTYKALHTALDTLSDHPASARRPLLLDNLLTIRHRLSRLLVVIRWYMSYSAFHNSATATHQLATSRAGVMTADADSLWHVSGVVSTSALLGSAILDASEILGGWGYSNMPACIPMGIGLEDDQDGDDSTKDRDKQSHPDAMIDITETKQTLTKPTITINLTSAAKREEDAIVRLHSATIELIRGNLPPGVKLFQTTITESFPASTAAVQIGVPDCWSASVVLDSLKFDLAIIILLNFSVSVGTHPDATSDLRSYTHCGSRDLMLGSSRVTPIRQMLQDRIQWRSAEVSGVEERERIAEMLKVLCDGMGIQCCGRLAMSHLRAQAADLVKRSYWKPEDFVVQGHLGDMKPTVELRIDYWQRASTMRGHFSLRARQRVEEGEGMSFKEAEILDVRHNNQPVSGGADLRMKSLALKTCLLTLLYSRAVRELKQVGEEVKSFFGSQITTRVTRMADELVSLVVTSKVHGALAQYSISLRTGAFRIRTLAYVAQSNDKACTYWDDLQNLVWSGGRFIRRTESASDILCEIITCMKPLLKCQGLRRISAIGNLDPYRLVESILPMKRKETVQKAEVSEEDLANGNDDSNVESVAVSSIRPLSPRGLQSPAKRGKVELIINDNGDSKVESTAAGSKRPPSSRDPQGPAKRPRVDITTNDNVDSKVGFAAAHSKRPSNPRDSQGPAKRPRVDRVVEIATRPTGFHVWHHHKDSKDVVNAKHDDKNDYRLYSAGMMAEASEELHINRLASRRAIYLDKLSRLGIQSRRKDLNLKRSPYRTALHADMKPLEVEGCALTLKRENGFQVSMTLLNHPFDMMPYTTSMDYFPPSKLLVFEYSTSDDAAFKRFYQDLQGIRTAALIIEGLARSTRKGHSVVLKTPYLITLKASGIDVKVFLEGKSVRIGVGSEHPIIKAQLVNFLEEIINKAAKDKGERLADLLDISIPVGLAIESSAPSDPKRFRVRFSTPLRARYVIGGNSKTFAIDIDAREGGSRVLLIDVARAEGRMPPVKGKRSNSFQPIPVWESMVGVLQSKKYGTVVHSGAAIHLSKVALARVLGRAIESAIR